MDPLSITASILTVIATANLVSESLKVAASATEDLEELSSEVSNLERSLWSISDTLNRPGDETSDADRLFNALRAAKTRINDLQSLYSQTSRHAGQKSARDHWTGIKRKNHISRLRNGLQSIRLAVDNIVSVDSESARNVSLASGLGTAVSFVDKDSGQDALLPSTDFDIRGEGRFRPSHAKYSTEVPLSPIWGTPAPLSQHDLSALHTPPRSSSIERGRRDVAGVSDPTCLPIPLGASQPQAPRSKRLKSSPGRIRPCYILIFLGSLTIAGSLIPALWLSIARKDMSNGFSMAQYILGLGVFIVGCAVAIHSRTCTCWVSNNTTKQSDSTKPTRCFKLTAMDISPPAMQAVELPT